MTNKEIIEKFYADVENLGLKFPVAAIAEKTGYSKGNVSVYLSKKKEPSESFLKKFYLEFKESFTNVPRDTVSSGNNADKPQIDGLILSLRDLI